MSAFPVFPTTHWSFITELRDASGESREALVGSFLVRYLPPMRSYLGYSFPRLATADADDLMQDFVHDRLIRRSLLDHAQQNRGSLRAFIRKCLLNFANSWLKRESRFRPARFEDIGFEAWGAEKEPAGGCQFEAAWAKHVIQEGVSRLRAECDRSGKVLMWQVFDSRFLKPISGSEEESYNELSARLGGVDAKQLANLLTTSKRRLKLHLLDVIGDYTRGGEEAESEIHALFRAVQ